MNRLVTLLVLSLMMCSCISTKEYADYISQKYATDQPIATAHCDSIHFQTSSNAMSDSLVDVKNLKSYFIPAGIYWGWNKTLRCELNESMVAQRFQQYFLYYADSLNLKEKLKNKRLEIRIDTIPNRFIYTNRGDVIFLLFAYSYAAIESVYPEKQTLSLSYQLFENNIETKAGTVLLDDINQPYINMMKSTKKLTWEYLDLYEDNLKTQGKRLATRFQYEVEKNLFEME